MKTDFGFLVGHSVVNINTLRGAGGNASKRSYKDCMVCGKRTLNACQDCCQIYVGEVVGLCSRICFLRHKKIMEMRRCKDIYHLSELRKYISDNQLYKLKVSEDDEEVDEVDSNEEEEDDEEEKDEEDEIVVNRKKVTISNFPSRYGDASILPIRSDLGINRSNVSVSNSSSSSSSALSASNGIRAVAGNVQSVSNSSSTSALMTAPIATPIRPGNETTGGTGATGKRKVRQSWK